jgi:predicted MPP superfamily phosphohydrolase
MKKIIKFLIILIVFIVCVLLYAKYIGTMGFITKEYTLYHESLPTSFDGLKVVHFSDLHYKRFIDENKMQEVDGIKFYPMHKEI